MVLYTNTDEKTEVSHWSNLMVLVKCPGWDLNPALCLLSILSPNTEVILTQNSSCHYLVLLLVDLIMFCLIGWSMRIIS